MEENNSGIQLNKKTIIGISVILVVILFFAGLLTQVISRGEYFTYPDDCYSDSNGNLYVLNNPDSVYSADGSKKVSFDNYIDNLRSAGLDITVVDDISDYEGFDDVSGMVIDGTYHKVDYKMPLWKIPASIILVFGSENVTTGIAIILFIVLIGGTFFILDDRGILKYIMAVIINKFENRKYLLLAIMIFICMLLSSTAGILEESVTLVPIAVAISLALGWDSLVGLSISLVSVAFGFTAATFNPFNVVTVQKLAGIPVFSGLWLRIVMFALVYIVLATFVISYAKKIEKNPAKSICKDSDEQLREKYRLDNSVEILKDEKSRKATKSFVICLILVIACIILDFILDMGGMVSMPGMALLFTAGGIMAGYISGLKGKALFNGFIKGVKTITPAIPLIFFILAITYILDEGMIIHTILYYVYNLVSGLSPYTAILILFAFIVVLEFFIGSGTAKAFLIMPIVAPLASLIGISGNSVVLTFCMGDGFTNLLYPTSGIMIIAIGLVNISYGKWLKYTWKLFLAEGLLSVAIMHFSIMINYA